MDFGEKPKASLALLSLFIVQKVKDTSFLHVINCGFVSENVSF